MEEQQLTQDQVDEQECGKRVDYWLKKYGCVLDGQCVLTTGQPPVIRVGIRKLPAEVLKELKKREKQGQPVGPDGQSTSKA